MQIGSLHSDKNPNAYWINSIGFWMSYFSLILIFHLALMSIPFFSTALVWTLTHFSHSIITYIAFHLIKGAPFDTQVVDNGAVKNRTHWEQIDKGKQMTTSKKLLTIIPVILFILASFYTDYQFNHFCANGVSLLIGVVPKFPLFHMVRFFGINKY